MNCTTSNNFIFTTYDLDLSDIYKVILFLNKTGLLHVFLYYLKNKIKYQLG